MTTTDFERIAGFDDVTRNDQRFDGQFYSAVLTTGIFCRPGCPGRPRSENVRFFTTAAAAAESGFRPCLRCHPESAPDPPERQSASPVISRALRLINEGLLDHGSVAELAAELNVSPRQLQRLFVEELGAPPIAVAQTRRLLFAKKLIDETDLSMADIAFSAGYSSVRRFNESIRQTYGRTPTDLRRKRRRATADPGSATVELKLFYRDPYNWPAMLGFLSEHAIPLVETIDRNVYRRTIRIGGINGTLSVRPLANQRAVLVRVPATLSRYLLPITERVKQIFDLKADPATIDASLVSVESLAALIRTHQGMRLPGCWDGFEVAVRALISQGTTECDRELALVLANTYGESYPDSGDPALTRLFPTPERLSYAPLDDIGVAPDRAAAIRKLSQRICDGTLELSHAASPEKLISGLGMIPGIDANVTRMIALRLLGDPDVDLCQSGPTVTTYSNGDQPLTATESGAPWRSYAWMYRWAEQRA